MFIAHIDTSKENTISLVYPQVRYYSTGLITVLMIGVNPSFQGVGGATSPVISNYCVPSVKKSPGLGAYTVQDCHSRFCWDHSI